MGKSSSSSGEISFPDYLENIHSKFLTSNENGKNLLETFNRIYDENPYTSWLGTDVPASWGYLGSGMAISQFPSLFDMFGKFMAGLDIEVLWSQIYEETVNGPEADDLVAKFNQRSLDNMNQNSLPMLNAGMRDIGAINSTAYQMGKALLEQKRMNEVSNFDAKVRFQMLTFTQARWEKHLAWNESTIRVYASLVQNYYADKQNADVHNWTFKAKEARWELDIFDDARAFIGALNGAPAAAAGEEPSQLQSSIGGALSGAATGAMIGGGPMGAFIGGTLGLAASFL